MIVNPQLFNYRLITGALVVAIVVLSIYSFSNYKSSESQQAFLEQEKMLMTNELSEMLDRYEEVNTNNDLISSQLVEAKETAKNALDSIGILEVDIAVYSKYKRQLAGLRTQNTNLFNSLDSLEQVNVTLLEKNSKVEEALSEEIVENRILKTKNDELNTKVEIASKFYADHLEVKAFTFTKGLRTETKKATNAETIEVCFTVSENILTQAGEKDLYIQILNPKNNVYADKGAVSFGDASLIYSSKKIIYYDNEAQDICVNVNADRDDKPLLEGLYYISVFHDDRKLASTKVILE